MSSRRLQLGTATSSINKGGKTFTIQDVFSATAERNKQGSNGATSDKKSTLSLKGMSKSSDPRAGVLTALVLGIGPPMLSKTGGGGGGDSGGGADGNAAPNVGGGGGGAAAGKQPTDSITVAIIKTEDVNVENYATPAPQDNAELGPLCLFYRDHEGGLRMTYAMYGAPILGQTRAKDWRVVDMHEKLEFVVRDGQSLSMNVWGLGGITVGSLVSLTNVMLSKVLHTQSELKQINNINPATAGRPEFGKYFFQSTPVSLDSSKDPHMSCPLHTRMRAFWPPSNQVFLSTKQLCEIHRQSIDCTDDYRALPSWAKTEEEINAHLATLPVRRFQTKKMTPVSLLCVDPTGGITPCCDEYDATYMKELAEYYRSQIESHSTTSTPDSRVALEQFTKQLAQLPDVTEAELAYSFLNTARGYSIMTPPDEYWPSIPDHLIHKAATGAEEPYFRWETIIRLASWGSPSCLTDPNYISPADDGFEPDLKTGLVVDMREVKRLATETGVTIEKVIESGEAAPRYHSYDFKRVGLALALYSEHIKLGPTDEKQFTELLLSHRIPFDVLVCPQIIRCAGGETPKKVYPGLPAFIDEMGRQAREEKARDDKISLIAMTPEEQDGYIQRDRDIETARWTELTEKQYKEMSESPDEIDPEKDGLAYYAVKSISWRLPEYLKNTGGVQLCPDEMAQFYEGLVDIARSENKESTVNPLAVEAGNKEGFIYLNDLKVNPSKLDSSKYSFYALVCYGSNPGRNQHFINLNKSDLEKHVQMSKIPKPSTETCTPSDLTAWSATRTAVIAYLNGISRNVSTFFYAVDDSLSTKCTRLAKKRFGDACKRYMIRNGLATTTTTQADTSQAFNQADNLLHSQSNGVTTNGVKRSAATAFSPMFDGDEDIQDDAVLTLGGGLTDGLSQEDELETQQPAQRQRRAKSPTASSSQSKHKHQTKKPRH